jgi:hypothetical protein
VETKDTTKDIDQMTTSELIKHAMEVLDREHEREQDVNSAEEPKS